MDWTTPFNLTAYYGLSSSSPALQRLQELNPSLNLPGPAPPPSPGPRFSLLPVPALLLLTPLMLSLILVSVGSNVLVLLSYRPHMLFVDAQSLYLLHLAVSDLLISMFCMPLHFVSTLWSAGWPLGRAMCQVYTAVQLTLLNVTTLLLVLVALDGLQQAEEGVRSTGREARKKAYVWLGLCWILAAAVNVPETLSWDAIQEHTYVPDEECRPEFNRSVGHVLFVQVWSFFLPVLILSVINTRLYFRLRRLSLTMLTFGHAFPGRAMSARGAKGEPKESLQTHNPTALSDTNAVNEELQDLSLIALEVSYDHPGQKHAAKPGASKAVYSNRSPLKSLSISSRRASLRSLSTGHISRILTQTGRRSERTRSVEGRRSRSSSDIKDVGPVDTDARKTAEGVRILSGSEASSGADEGRKKSGGAISGGCLASRSRGHMSLETPYRLKRVAVILFTLVLILVVCWLPYSVAFLVRSVCQDCVHPIAYSILVWVLYFKSCINPFLYAYNTFAFRSSYRRLLVRIFPVRGLRRMTTDRVSKERASILN
ncbi:hypothetical protein ACOMHN_047082 [Nucella lapillus]